MLTKLCRCGRKIKVDDTCSVCGDRHRRYDKQARDPKTAAFYKSTHWTKLSKIIRDRYYGIDVYHLFKYGKIIPSEMVHHIIPIKDDWDRRLDPDVLLPVSHESHAEIESIYRASDEHKSILISELFGYIKQFREGDIKKV
ncbi:HNH endonuclease [Peptostreptococcus equinus]|uniref:HNH endonuclease n=1 Tax=Peptostreptococcus equinus TaxID=3003601 RepID=A0ABY7JN05_9FIRM|nr:HNH endonuclease [Peptostreptococcus sp. CBA3647]WAW14755.1 HNH endonuclease [Peptostreptococcus sp. CBA3647]